MKKTFTLLICLSLFISYSFGNGVAVVDAAQGIYFQLLQSHVQVDVNNQIATTKARHVFKNTTTSKTLINYAFPLSENASATNIRWQINGIWYTAPLIAAPQDTTLSIDSSGNNVMFQALDDYLGNTPLFFSLDDSIDVNQVIIIELTYVELLSYNNNFVQYSHPNDYNLIQTTNLDSLTFNFQVLSARDIMSIDLFSHSGSTINNTITQANLNWFDTNSAPTTNFELEYELDENQLGLFNFSTFLPDSLNYCDTINNGYFAMIVEPDGTDSTAVIDKVFTLIIDVSGSMNGSKMAQARDAATFIVNNINFGDKFNIVAFSSSATSWQPNHVQYTATNQTSALNFISTLTSGGGTSFDDAFNTAVPQFTYDTTVANIIIFLTDGLANQTDNVVLSNLSNLIGNNNLLGNIAIHTFGIGDNVNQSLLSIIATQYNGLATFVGNNNLAAVLSAFYSYIKNPVLLNIQANFSPSNIIHEIYPLPLPNLYKGQQMVIVGRYSIPDSVQVTFNGQAFGNPTSFQYDFTLTDSLIVEHQFLVKIWAKMKMDNLMTQFYNAGQNTILADSIQKEVTELSLCNGIVSPFTSFLGISGGAGGAVVSTYSEEYNEEEKLLPFAKIYPNPFISQTTIEFELREVVEEHLVIEIFDTKGRLIRTILPNINSIGQHRVVWDGLTDSGKEVNTGTYFCVIKIDREIVFGEIVIKL